MGESSTGETERRGCEWMNFQGILFESPEKREWDVQRLQSGGGDKSNRTVVKNVESAVTIIADGTSLVFKLKQDICKYLLATRQSGW